MAEVGQKKNERTTEIVLNLSCFFFLFLANCFMLCRRPKLLLFCYFTFQIVRIFRQQENILKRHKLYKP